MDNANTGALVRFLPPYSPDFNPIEELFSKVKAFLEANELAYDVTTSPSLLITMGFSMATFHMQYRILICVCMHRQI